MAVPTDHVELVALLRAGAHPWQIYADLLEEAGSARALMARLARGAGEETAQAALFADPPLAAPDETALAGARSALGEWRRRGFALVTVLEPGYPENLRAVGGRPPFIFVAGALSPRDARGVAVIGSRRVTPAGRRRAERLAAALVDAGYTVISGLASGVDAAAHRAALGRGGRTVAVLGTGLAHAYPLENAPLQEEIAARGALVSHLWPDTPPSRETFPARNAVMSGLSLATVIVEASVRSGARIQARHSLAQGRPVLIWHELRREPWGATLALQPGVHVYSDPSEVPGLVARLTGSRELTA